MKSCVDAVNSNIRKMGPVVFLTGLLLLTGAMGGLVMFRSMLNPISMIARFAKHRKSTTKQDALIENVLDEIRVRQPRSDTNLILIAAPETLRIDYSYLIYRLTYLAYPECLSFGVKLNDGSYRVESYDYRNGIQCFTSAMFCDRAGVGETLRNLQSRYSAIFIVNRANELRKCALDLP